MATHLAQPKDGGIAAPSLMFVSTMLTNPAREREYNTWYDTMHLADVLETEGYTVATRYARIDPDLGPGEPGFLALYEMSTVDPNEPPTAMRPIMDRKQKCGRRIECFERVHRVNLRRVTLGGKGEAREGRKPNGVVSIFYNCGNPAQVKELDRWCDQTYIPALMATGVFSAVSRWANGSPQPEPGEPQFVIILETQGDAKAARSRFHQHRQEWKQQGRMSPLLADVKMMSFRRISEPVTREIAAQSPARKEPWVSWADFVARHYPEFARTSAQPR